MKAILFCTIFLGTLLGGAFLTTGCTTTQPPNRQVADLRITAEVKSRLASEVQPSSLTNIEVNTTNGVVTLAGQVESEEIRSRAESVARNVAGVVSVNNNLQVQPTPEQVGRRDSGVR